MTKIKITKTKHSRLSDIDFNNIPFGKTFSDHMFVADYKDGAWGDFQIIPFGNFSLHPATMAIHYGQSIFEGMKASMSFDGQPLLFRPELHAARFNKSAERMNMPEFPEDVFLEAIHQLVSLEKDWIPPAKGSAMYIRPFMFSTDEFIGVKPSNTYKFVIIVGPVGPYYPKPISLITPKHYIRAAKGGTGFAKTAGNYGASLLPTTLANKAGFDQVLWLDAKEFKYVQEVGTMNIFFVIDGIVYTPPVADGTILNGVTRRSVKQILREKGYTVIVRNVAIDEIVAAYKSDKLQEVFGTGTAAVVANVSAIEHNGFLMEFPDCKNAPIAKTAKAEIDGLRAGTIEDTRGWIVPVNTSELAAN